LKLDRLILLFVAALIAIPLISGDLPIPYDWIDFPPVNGTLIIVYLILLKLLVNPTVKIKRTWIDGTFYFFVSTVLIAAVVGLLRSGSIASLVIKDLSLFVLYIAYLFPRLINAGEDFSKKILWVWMLSAVFVTIIYMRPLLHLQLGRVVTRQGNMAMAASLIALNRLVLVKDTASKKIMLLGVLFATFLSVLITLQRALWVSLTIGALLSTMFWVLVGRVTIKQILGVLLVLMGVIYTTYSIILKNFFWYGYHMIQRFLSIITTPLMTLPSLEIRLMHHNAVLEKIKNNPIFGRGLGDMIILPESGMWSWYVDNSYDTLLWKLGLLGLVAFLAFMGKSLMASYRIVKKSKGDEDIWFGISSFVVLITLLLSSMTTSFFMYYRFTFVVALLIGAIAVEYEKLRTQKTP
jgi:O-antigen ligase